MTKKAVITVRWNVILGDGRLCGHNHRTMDAAKRCSARVKAAAK